MTRSESLYGKLPTSVPLPPQAPASGVITWEPGNDVGTSYATRGSIQVAVELDTMSRWRRGDRAADRPKSKYQTVLRVRAPDSHIVICYVYADEVTRSEAKTMAEHVLHDTSNPMRAYVENALHGAFDPERDLHFGMFGNYVAPISARSKIEIVPVVRSGKKKPRFSRAARANRRR